MKSEECRLMVGLLAVAQVRMLLGRAYAGAGRGEEAEGVFDALIAAYPDDFRGYLAKVGSTLAL